MYSAQLLLYTRLALLVHECMQTKHIKQYNNNNAAKPNIDEDKYIYNIKMYIYTKS